MSRTVLKRTNLLLETKQLNQLRRKLRARSNSEAVRTAIDHELAAEVALGALGRLRERHIGRCVSPPPFRPQMSLFRRGLLLFDTSAYIRYLHEGSYSWLRYDRVLFRRTILPAVVAAELYAGGRGRDDKPALDAMCQQHRAVGTLSSPTLDSWLLGGILLQRYARLYGEVRFTYHFRAILIALEAVRHRATLMTENARNFLRWRRLLRANQQDLKVFDLRPLGEARLS